jgi:galactokinase/mevalonate kinase-like predicted kinase
MSTTRFAASAPARCGILGNPSDIYGGKVLACSAPVRARCELRVSESNHLPEDSRLWKAATDAFPIDKPVKVIWNTEIPRSSGLSGSTALLAATLASVLAMRGEAPKLDTLSDRSQFAERLRHIERYGADIMCGYQDAYMICHGGIQLMDFQGKNPIDAGPLAKLTPLDAPLPFLLVTTGVERLSGSVHGPMSNRWLEGDPDVREGIARISELAEPGARHLLEGDWAALGRLMNKNQNIIAHLGGSGDSVDALIASCKEFGVLGAKLAGAGMGGTIIALTEDAAGLELWLRSKGYQRFLKPAKVAGIRIEMAANEV